MAVLLQALVLLGLGFAAATTVYYSGLCLVALCLAGRRQLALPSNPASRFVLVIPAHDEEEALPETLHACAALEYPHSLYDVLVVADNCSDGTASVARALGARCLERQDPAQRGKGYALAWAFRHLESEDFDAVVVLDADCSLDPRALRVFDARLQQGAQAVQAAYVATNPTESPISYVVALGRHLENNFFYAPKTPLGLAVLLRGTGMVLRKEVLARLPWRAHSVAEDVEYSLDLVENDVPVVFEASVAVWSRFPASRQQLGVQRSRWAGGNWELARRRALPLWWAGWRRRSLARLDAAWTLVVQSRPFVLLELLAVLLVAMAAVWLRPDGTSRALLVVALALLGLQLLYLAFGILHYGLDRRRFALLLRSPFALGRLALISLRGLAGSGRDVWARTPRR
ncbi:MAG TPA: glycosyltransferase family 2 protein [Candidatus Krumholzibacteria bacterium]|nr:glycosyltransferase family 2 protein [Candidatus Krumholzibacteria bacterium]